MEKSGAEQSSQRVTWTAFAILAMFCTQMKSFKRSTTFIIFIIIIIITTITIIILPGRVPWEEVGRLYQCSPLTIEKKKVSDGQYILDPAPE